MQSAARSYFQTQVSTTTQGDLLIMLFDAALKFLRQAKEKIAARDYAQKGILISKALDILSELQSTLNAQKGGELADRLQKLYFFCSTRLLAANLNLDVAKIDEVMHILTGLREAFNEANAKVATKVVPTTGVQATGRPAVASAAPRVSQAAAAAAYPASMAVDTAAAPRQPAVQSAGPAPAKAEPAISVNIPTPVPGSAAPYTKAAPVTRIMAAYAASRAQG
ncbi:flagellar export chaperone FliS [Solidesulfovibrio sp.]|jgi:flagellar protein FliS|uniref:flagellar export chaperone FliS n=1 Tax=Solidesulfovibrio sp. TaxID=2910990 RepID=UPI002B2177F0|nr:flagellar export chaperone FliS [Solidesulfovibrio sp.]MEA5090806.1 flagellar export chaperone FliS [Solidesulfovibrio sp.]